MSLQRSGVNFSPISSASCTDSAREKSSKTEGHPRPSHPYESARTEIVRPLRDGLNSTVPAWVA